MDITTIEEAIESLQARGEKITARAIQRMVGGSYRDLLPRLRAVRAAMDVTDDADDADDADNEALPGTIAEARHRYPAACQAEQAAQRAYESLMMRWRELRSQAPATEPTTDVEGVHTWRLAVAAHQERLTELHLALEHQGEVVRRCALEAEHWRQEISRREVGAARARQRLAEAEARAHLIYAEAERKEQDAALLLAAAHREHQQADAAVRQAEADLRRFGAEE